MSSEPKNLQDIRREVRKTASRQLGKALKILRGRSPEVRSKDQIVHNTRRRLKEVRALLRLVQKDVGKKTFRRDNKALRNVARPLSEVRDAVALIEALGKLRKQYATELNENTLEPLRKILAARRAAIRRRILQKDGSLQEAASTIRKVRQRIDRWDVPNKRKALLSGLHETFEKGRQAMASASDDPSDEHLHEWRKRVKDLRYQLELLKPLWPDTMTAAGEQAHQLSDLLGDDHDLAVLAHLTECEFKQELHTDVVATIQTLVSRRRAELQTSAKALSEKLFEEGTSRGLRGLHGLKTA